jgi:hypothetical protein
MCRSRYLSQCWATDSRYNGQGSGDGDTGATTTQAPYLDAALTSWNFRDKIAPPAPPEPPAAAAAAPTLTFVQPPPPTGQAPTDDSAPRDVLPLPLLRSSRGDGSHSSRESSSSAAQRGGSGGPPVRLSAAGGAQAAYKYLLYIEGHCAACRYTCVTPPVLLWTWLLKGGWHTGIDRCHWTGLMWGGNRYHLRVIIITIRTSGLTKIYLYVWRDRY